MNFRQFSSSKINPIISNGPTEKFECMPGWRHFFALNQFHLGPRKRANVSVSSNQNAFHLLSAKASHATG